jgi:hypothetical protein
VTRENEGIGSRGRDTGAPNEWIDRVGDQERGWGKKRKDSLTGGVHM